MPKRVKESKEPKHHYIPCFYLQRWANANSRLIEFSRPAPINIVKPRPTTPRGTGYVRGLNTIPNLPPSEARYLEDAFFKIADDAAARALEILLTPPPWNMSVVETSTGKDPLIFNSWHAGVNPQAFTPWKQDSDYGIWLSLTHNNPRTLHFHAVGTEMPGELSLPIIDHTVEFDGVLFGSVASSKC